MFENENGEKILDELWTQFYASDDIPFVTEQADALLAHVRPLALRANREGRKLLCKVLQFNSMLAYHSRDYGKSLMLAKEAQALAGLLNDKNLEAVSLLRESLTYYYLGQSIPRFLAIAKAFVLDGLSPLVRARIWMAMSEALAARHSPGAAKIHDAALKMWPDKPHLDEHFSYTHFLSPDILSAKFFLTAGEEKEALEALKNFESSDFEDINAFNTEILSVAAPAMIHNFKRAATLIAELARRAEIIGSPLRLAQAHAAYDKLEQRYPQYKRDLIALKSVFH